MKISSDHGIALIAAPSLVVPNRGAVTSSAPIRAINGAGTPCTGSAAHSATTAASTPSARFWFASLN